MYAVYHKLANNYQEYYLCRYPKQNRPTFMRDCFLVFDDPEKAIAYATRIARMPHRHVGLALVNPVDLDQKFTVFIT